jgi:hypothetical protein
MEVGVGRVSVMEGHGRGVANGERRRVSYLGRMKSMLG